MKKRPENIYYPPPMSGDVASIFGCMVGMKDAVTAITLVALGTSLPDTFASKIAAESVSLYLDCHILFTNRERF